MIDTILHTVASFSATQAASAAAVFAFLALVAHYARKGYSRDSAKSDAGIAMNRFAANMSYAGATVRLKFASKNALIKLFALRRHFKNLEERLQKFRRFGASIFQWRELARDANDKADQAWALTRQANEERDWSRLASDAKKKAECALSLLSRADRQAINTAPLHAALAEARRHYSDGNFEQAYKCAHPIEQRLEFALEDLRLCKRLACFSEETVSMRDRSIYTTAHTHLEKARVFMRSEETFKQVRTQLTCARIKIEYLEENSPKK